MMKESRKRPPGLMEYWSEGACGPYSGKAVLPKNLSAAASLLLLLIFKRS